MTATLRRLVAGKFAGGQIGPCSAGLYRNRHCYGLQLLLVRFPLTLQVQVWNQGAYISLDRGE